MALHGEIRVNGMTIGTWEAVRQGDNADPQPDDLLTYACAVNHDTTLQGNPAVLETFSVIHRFGDGALALTANVLATAFARSVTKR